MDPRHVVVIGGGTGSYNALRGLKERFAQITSIVSMMDDGGSTGRLRDEFGHLPPGDARRCLLALSRAPQTLRSLIEYRFSRGLGLGGHSFGNLLLTALREIHGSESRAIEVAGEILNITGRVLPVTEQDAHVCAELADGTTLRGESSIDTRGHSTQPITRIYLEPRARIYEPARKAIAQADLILIGPGDLYTSLIPNLCVDGVAQALRTSRATVIYASNIMTKRGESDHYTLADFARAIETHLGHGVLDIILANHTPPTPEQARRYAKEGAAYVQPMRIPRLRVLRRSLISPTDYARHDPHKLARAIASIT